MTLEETKEIRRLIKAIDLLADRLNDREKSFIIDMIDHPEYELTPKRVSWIELIAKKHDIY